MTSKKKEPMLVDYFKAPQYKRALDSYANFARERNWGIDHKLTLYNRAKIAFNPSLPEQTRRKTFYVIYENLKSYWQVFRNARWGYWTADETFEMLEMLDTLYKKVTTHHCKPLRYPQNRRWNTC